LCGGELGLSSFSKYANVLVNEPVRAELSCKVSPVALRIVPLKCFPAGSENPPTGVGGSVKMNVKTKGVGINGRLLC